MRFLLSGLPDLIQELMHLAGMTCHAVFKHVVGVGRKAFDLGALMSKLGNLDGKGLVIRGIAKVAASGVGLEQGFPECPVVGKLHERRERRARDTKGVVSFWVTTLGGFIAGGSEDRFGQPAKVVITGQDQLELVGLGQYIVPKAGFKCGQLLVDVADLLSGRGIEFSAGSNKIVINRLQQ